MKIKIPEGIVDAMAYAMTNAVQWAASEHPDFSWAETPQMIRHFRDCKWPELYASYGDAAWRAYRFIYSLDRKNTKKFFEFLYYKIEIA